MALKEPFPDLEEILDSIGAGGGRVAAIDASEGAAGNISVYVGWPMEVRRRFSDRGGDSTSAARAAPREPPRHRHRVGRRLREICDNPVANLGVVRISSDGTAGTLHTAPTRLVRTGHLGVELASRRA